MVETYWENEGGRGKNNKQRSGARLEKSIEAHETGVVSAHGKIYDEYILFLRHVASRRLGLKVVSRTSHVGIDRSLWHL